MKHNYCFGTTWETVETVNFSNFLLTHDLSRRLLQQHASTVLTVSKYINKNSYSEFNIYRMFFLKIIFVLNG